jgi:hypothetical protein
VLRLADRLQAPGCVKAAGNTLLLNAAASSTRRLPWEAVLAAFELPALTDADADADADAVADACDECAAATAAAALPLREAAQEQLLQDLGDLDLAWLDGKLRERLLALPFEAVRCAGQWVPKIMGLGCTAG